MITPKIKTVEVVIPMIYAYTTPEIKRHDGWTKIGYTERDVTERIREQTHTANVKWNLEWKGMAIFDDGTAEPFRDEQFHSYLQKKKIEREPGTEWFNIDGPCSQKEFYEFKASHGVVGTLKEIVPYKLRQEQENAVQITLDYAKNHEEGEFLWNAKPRFGKTLSVYDFCKRMKANTVLVVTNRPAIANSWFDDYEKFFGSESGYLFVSEVDALKNRTGVLTRQEYLAKIRTLDRDHKKCIEFVSLQDLKGSIYFGGSYDKLGEISKQKGIEWDVLVIDEAHEGVDTYRTDIALEQIKRKFTLHLSGTPFKAIANNKFEQDAIFNWTYADEQKAKREWDSSNEEKNPYEALPQLNLFTYQMSEIVKDELSRGKEINGETVEYAFDLNEFFRTEKGKFVYSSSVDKFLDALTIQKRFPFSTPELRNELKHTLWLLDRVDSAKALAEKLKAHPVFSEYYVVLAAGDGKLSEDEENAKSFDRVKKAISEYEKTITLSVGQLTTGVTIEEWTASLMLSNIKSPSLYMQAAFRSQNPCLFKNGTELLRKENAYVFDFDPARTLIIYEEFANDLNLSTASGQGSSDQRKENIKELLNFFPVIGEDENGELIELDAEKVLSIPRKIKSAEVVRRGFMSNFLFQNISNIFGAPSAVLDILNKFEPVKEPKKKELAKETFEAISVDEEGKVQLNNEYVIGRSADVFGDKVFEISNQPEEFIYNVVVTGNDSTKEASEKFKDAVKQSVVKPLVETAKDGFGSSMTKSDQKRIESQLNNKAERAIDKTFANYKIETNVLEQEKTEELQKRFETGKTVEEIDKMFAEKQKQISSNLQNELFNFMSDFVQDSKTEIVEKTETKIKEREKNSVEDGVRDHLRGFARTIPSFLMAYGTSEVTLKTFDEIIPDEVFLEVTSITLDEFKFLRDGGEYFDRETGKTEFFKGHLFDEVVFDDSIREFLGLKEKLSNYFDESAIEDIFDYVPPQKTNQIFTPKHVVVKMVDLLEEENPGCFDDDSNTFADLYMKSGLYIAEIVKRLFQSEVLKEKYPNDNVRLAHIFKKQVYGLAPTEIIYKIATNFILGFDSDAQIAKHNFRQLDALPYAKEGTLKEKLDEIYGS